MRNYSLQIMDNQVELSYMTLIKSTVTHSQRAWLPWFHYPAKCIKNSFIHVETYHNV